jgi:serine/threonine-protein kinase
MGEVYRARDPRVGRDVAIKISTEHFSDRFEREARAVAALNHPNICTLHDVGPNYLVMELVDGDSPHGPLPVKTVLAYARQIADALDAAHEKGIVHRDLKPANIKVRPDGTVKVLDFGLAKIATESAGDADVSNSPTLGLDRTQAGTILGTAPYMSPEQARGKTVDKRSDIWAFGVVLYELVTGRRAFDGDDVSTVLAAVIKSEPRWDGIPSELRRLLESCLQKDPRKRLRDIGDAWTLIDDRSTPVQPRSRNSSVGWIAALVFAVVAGLAFWAPWRKARVEQPSPVTRLDVDLGQDVALEPLVIPTPSSLIISPDGRRLVFPGGVSGGPSKLFTRRLDESKVTELVGTQGALNPFFFAGRSVGGLLGRHEVDQSLCRRRRAGSPGGTQRHGRRKLGRRRKHCCGFWYSEQGRIISDRWQRPTVAARETGNRRGVLRHTSITAGRQGGPALGGQQPT